MASAFGHSFAAMTLVGATRGRKLSLKLLLASVISSVIPDADVLAFKLGIAYGDMLGHRGFSHSLLFAGLWAASLSLALFRGMRLRAFATLFLCTASHGLLDAMTNGGLGVGFFIPFDPTRYFLGFRPIEVSPIQVSRFFDQAWRVLSNELVWIGLPCLAFLAVALPLRRALVRLSPGGGSKASRASG